MAFSGLADRYNATYHELYKLPDKSSDSVEPFLEFAPDDPRKDEVSTDTQQTFPGTIRRETLRLGRFLKNSRGMMFLIDQAELQTGNVFSETRIYDPLFLGSLIDPWVHIQRPLSTAAATSISGNGVSPASDNQIGSAGRLQIATKNTVIGNRMGAKGATGLLNLILPGNPLVQAASSFLSAVQDGGIVGVDQRPEIDFQGEYFSVATWRGFTSQGKQGDPLSTVGSKLLKGDIAGATNALFNGIVSSVIGSAGTLGTLVDTSTSRGALSGDTQFAGYRYFVTNGSDETAVDRYIKDVIVFKSVPTGIAGQFRSVPTVHMAPWSSSPTLNAPNTTITPNTTQLATDAIKKVQTDINNTIRSIKRIGSFLFGGTPAPTQAFNPLNAIQIGPVSSTDPNPAFARMIYPDLSLQSRYADKAKTDTNLNTQIVSYKVTYNPNTMRNKGTAEDRVYGISQHLAGFGGGLKPNYQNNTDSLSPIQHTAPGYVIFDSINLTSPLFDNDADSVSNSVMKTIRDSGNNLIDFLFYDFVNSKVLPFRAFLTDMNQSSTANVAEQQYIGRIERNIVYIGVIREVSFSFRIQAFSKKEMSNVWTKINYLQGLQFPSMYSDGFLVPPLVKLTIGNVYKDQPGYIKSMTYKFDDDDWEIDEGNQVPQGITVNISYSIIEKQQMSTSSTFYPYGADSSAGSNPPVNVDSTLINNVLNTANTDNVQPINGPGALPVGSIVTQPTPTLADLLGG